MLDADGIAALLRAAAYFASRPAARIGRDRENDRRIGREKRRRQRRRGDARLHVEDGAVTVRA